ncbi:MAG TPA: pitrilysin family protein [Clostridia bacterium]|nr:pitrilysin family protein [Clostridia bacterium]
MEKITLSNGFRILLDYDNFARSCTMGIWVGSGSGYESPESSGASHFIEHMIFKGTPDRNSYEISTQIDEIGGALNAYTTKEYTCFYCRSLTDHVGKALDILCDMVKNPRLEPKDVETEKGVVLEEIALYEDSPEDLCLDTFYENSWFDNAFGRNILGSRETVNELNSEALRAHMAEFYVPERMVASLCGRFDKDAVISTFEKYFGSLKPTSNPIKRQSLGFSPFIKTINKDFEQNQIILGFEGIRADVEDRFACGLLCNILGGSSSSRLFQRIRENLGLVYSIGAFNAAYLNGGLIGISMGLSHKAEEQALTESLKILREFPHDISEKELSRVQEQAAAGLVMGLESTPARASRMGRSEILFNSVDSQDMLIENYRSVTLDNIRRVSEKLLNLEKIAICSVGKVYENDFYLSLISNT